MFFGKPVVAFKVGGIPEVIAAAASLPEFGDVTAMANTLDRLVAVSSRVREIYGTRIRAAVHDPRIHFAINCAAKSCPPIRMEPYGGDRIDVQLDDQVRRFLRSTVRFERKGDTMVIDVSRILDWFNDDFGDKLAFLRRYVSVPPASKTEFKYDDYDWSLNDWRR